MGKKFIIHTTQKITSGVHFLFLCLVSVHPLPVNHTSLTSRIPSQRNCYCRDSFTLFHGLHTSKLTWFISPLLFSLGHFSPSIITTPPGLPGIFGFSSGTLVTDETSQRNEQILPASILG
jgi:hypothetical protein